MRLNLSCKINYEFGIIPLLIYKVAHTDIYI